MPPGKEGRQSHDDVQPNAMIATLDLWTLSVPSRLAKKATVRSRLSMSAPIVWRCSTEGS